MYSSQTIYHFFEFLHRVHWQIANFLRWKCKFTVEFANTWTRQLTTSFSAGELGVLDCQLAIEIHIVPREKIAPFQIHSVGLNLIMFSNLNVCSNTQDFSQQNMFVFIIFSWIVRHETLIISRPDNLVYWQNWQPSTPKNSKHVCSASESSSY